MCEKKTKKLNRKRQIFIKIATLITFDIQEVIVNETKELYEVKKLKKVNGVDLIAKEGIYHKWFPKNYANLANTTIRKRLDIEQVERTRLANVTKEALDSIVCFV